MKGFKKDGKFIPTGNKTKSTLKKNDVTKKRFKKSDDNANRLKIQKEREEREQKAREHSDKVDREIGVFGSRIVPFGSGDVATAIDKGLELGMWGGDVADLVTDWQDSTEMKLEDIDVVAVVYEHELQTARNKISEVLNYDFLNDAEHSGTEIYVHSNYMASSFDYSQEALDELQSKINGATGEQKDELEEDTITKIFLRDLDISLDDPENQPQP
jgi:hypothetical protein